MKTMVLAVAITGLLSVAVQSPVPVDDEPRHHLKFENEYTRVFDVQVPPSDATLFHTHSHDYLFVMIGDALLKAQVLGGPLSDLVVKNGEARFTKATITHRVINVGKRLFRNITIEILASPKDGPDAAHVEMLPGHSLVLDNDLIRVERLILDPGKSNAVHLHRLPGLGVAISDGKILSEAPGVAAEVIEIKAGDFRWHEAGLEHAFTNLGAGPLEIIDISWKTMR
jgi:mannose-6-phosphate isomerase-like protein (cupin superfamily)